MAAYYTTCMNVQERIKYRFAYRHPSGPADLVHYRWSYQTFPGKGKEKKNITKTSRMEKSHNVIIYAVWRVIGSNGRPNKQSQRTTIHYSACSTANLGRADWAAI